MLITHGHIIACNAEGLAMRSEGYTYPGDRHSPVLSIALTLGFEHGVDLSTCPVVSGWRFGAVPESGVSHNYRDDTSERGLSLCAVDDAAPVGSAMFFTDRPQVQVSGVLLPYLGSDGEPLVLPVDAVESWD